MSNERVFKIFWKDQVRRFSAPVVSWSEFQEKLRVILGADYHPELQVQYIDDEGDRVELATQYEWEACLAQVPVGGIVKLYIKPHDHGVYFKDSPAPEIRGVHIRDGTGNQTAVDSPLASAVAGTVPQILASFFPDGKILPRNIPDWLAGAVRADHQHPFQADVDINVLALIDAIFDRALRTMQSNLVLADELWGKALAIAQTISPATPKLNFIYYNIACTKSLLGDKAEAISNLRAAIENGYCNFEHAERDADLNNIRQEPEFKILITDKLRPVAVPIIEEKMETLAIKEEQQEEAKVEEQPMQVEAEEPKEEQKPESQPEPEVPFAKELEALKSMGFTQPDNTLIVLLAAYNGDVNGVIGHLFSQS